MHGCKKIWAQGFLAGMTAVCLWGAWRTSYRLPLPQDDAGYSSFAVEYVDYDGWYKGSISKTQQDALTKLLRETALRRNAKRSTFGGLAEPDDFYYCIDLIPENPALRGMHFSLFLGRRNGQDYGEGQFLHARTNAFFRIPDPEPLLAFLENEVNFQKEVR